jgi:CDP-paratose 2-epimerase
MKILITGGCGFVGSNIAIYLKKKMKKAKIFSLDNLIRRGSSLNRNRLNIHKIKNFKVNIEKYEKIKKLPKFDLIIDCCAEPAIEASNINPDRVFKTNLIGTFNILKKCITDNSNIIFLSSSRVYSINKLLSLIKDLNLKKSIKINKKINENFETQSASSLYGFTKLASEKLIKEFFFNTNLKYIINRFGVIAGPWQFGKQDQGFVSLWMGKHFFKKKLSYIGFGGNGNQIRDILHIEDACEIIFLQIKKLKKINNTVFNIGGGPKNKISLKELTLKCEKLTNNKIYISKVPKTSKLDVPYFVTDNTKISKFYNWRPLLNVDMLLNDIYRWLKENKKFKNYF